MALPVFRRSGDVAPRCKYRRDKEKDYRQSDTPCKYGFANGIAIQKECEHTHSSNQQGNEWKYPAKAVLGSIVSYNKVMIS
jgi:hypothetical protein